MQAPDGIITINDISDLIKVENPDLLKSMIRCCRTNGGYKKLLDQLALRIEKCKSLRIQGHSGEYDALLLKVNTEKTYEMSKYYLITTIEPMKLAEDQRIIGKLRIESEIVSFGDDHNTWYLKPLTKEEVTDLALLTKRKSVRPSEPTIVANVKRNASEDLVKLWDSLEFRNTEQCYRDACELAKTVDYDSIDISGFITKIAGSNDRKTGLFISALLNHGDEAEYIIDVRDLGRPSLIGFRATSRVTIVGNCGPHAGKEQIGGELTFKDDTDYGAAAWKSGGTTIIEGSSGDFTGLCMRGGDLIVLGHAGRDAVHEITGGFAEFSSVQSFGRFDANVRTTPDGYTVHFEK